MKNPIMLEILDYKSNFENVRAGPGWDPSGVGSFRGGVLPGMESFQGGRGKLARITVEASSVFSKLFIEGYLLQTYRAFRANIYL